MICCYIKCFSGSFPFYNLSIFVYHCKNGRKENLFIVRIRLLGSSEIGSGR